MGAIKLELQCAKDVDGIAADPQPDWSFDALLLELNSMERKLNVSTKTPMSFSKTHTREYSAAKGNRRTPNIFSMRVSDDEVGDLDRDAKALSGRRFACDELYLSDDSDDESPLGIQCHLMDKGGLIEGALSELIHDYQLSVTETMRNQMVAIETELIDEKEKLASTLAQVEKSTEAKREMEKKFDMQYHRKIAEALDNHLTAVQRDHEHRSQIEERKIRDDAAREEAKRKEKALQEEKARQAKLQAEAEARLEAERAEKEKAKAAALEAERKAKAAALENKTSQTMTKLPAKPTEISNVALKPSSGSVSGVQGAIQLAGRTIKGSENALKMEERRLQKHNEVTAQNKALGLGSDKAFRKREMEISRRIRTIAGSKENVRVKAEELIGLIGDPSCPQPISVAMFSEKVVSLCVNPTGSFNSAVYAYCHVIVVVTSKIPLAMDILIAELNRVCIYTVPKYISYSQSAFDTKEAYYKAIGYQEEDGKIETTDSYVERLSSYMKLYGALVQTEVEGVQNLHGFREGWAWLARFLNALPANLYTAVALQAFLEMAGFALYRRYKTQFVKLINIIAHDFLPALRAGEGAKLDKVIVNIRNYIESKQFLQEPDGWQLKSSLESHKFAAEPEYEHQYHYSANRSFY